MANFTDINEAIIVNGLHFSTIAENTLQQIICKDGEIAGFQIRKIPFIGGLFEICQIYDCSTGTPILQGTISVVKGLDLLGGLFSSGCFPDGDPLTAGTNFYRVDY